MCTKCSPEVYVNTNENMQDHDTKSVVIRAMIAYVTTKVRTPFSHKYFPESLSKVGGATK